MFDTTIWCNPGKYKTSVMVCLDAETMYLNTGTCAIRKNGINQNGVNVKHKRSKPSAVKEVIIIKKEKKRKEETKGIKERKKETGIENIEIENIPGFKMYEAENSSENKRKT